MVTTPLEGLSLSRSALDRAAHRRSDDDWLRAAWADPRTRVLVVDDGAVPVLDGPGNSGTARAPRLALLAPRDAPAGERFFLGVEAGGAAFFAVPAPLPPVDGARPAGLREVGALLDDRDAGLLVHAVALDNWHRTHTHCPRCGAPTRVAGGGHLRRCDRDGSEHYPRTDPAVIMAVVDADDRVLLGHQPRWPARRFSTLAGFVEPGESLEAAVRREVLEEAGVVVGAVTYAGSQPWPFPSSLMLGFYARAETTAIRLEDEEISEARWFTRAELVTATETGEVLLPPPVSIARRLVEGWWGGPLPGDW